MKTRPWPIVLLAIIHILGPVGNTFLSAQLQHLNPIAFLSAYIRTQSLWKLFDFFLIYPLAGLAIYACKKWSYPLFLAVSFYTVYSNYLIWKIAPQIYPFALFGITTLLDIVFVGYFLNSAVRAMYMNPRLRWWESKPRYLIGAPCTVRIDGAADQAPEYTAEFADISENGIFLLNVRDSSLKEKQSILLNFTLLGQDYQSRGRVIHCRKEGCGVIFLHDKDTKKKLKALCRVLKFQDVPIRGAVNLKEDFKNWIITLLKTGEGLIPK